MRKEEGARISIKLASDAWMENSGLTEYWRY